MNKKALLCILITYCITTLHCIFDVIRTFQTHSYPFSVQHALAQGAFLISTCLFIESLIFALIMILNIREYWKLFVPMILITGVLSGHYLLNIYKPHTINKYESPKNIPR
jgi:hypothetical protein